jgi:glycerophosphoryl diester phosphodiesterase
MLADNDAVPLPRTPVFYAHRGAAAALPENTMPSFRRALELGAHALEMDVHMTRDEHVIVSHDPGGGRMANVACELRAVTLAETQRWDFGWGFVGAGGARPFAGKGYQAPTLEQVLRELPGVPLNIDLKQQRPSIAARVVELVRRHRAAERVTLASFHLGNMLAVRRLGYEGPTALSQAEVATLLATPRAALRRLPFFGTVAQLPVRVGPLVLASRRLIDKCHDLGMAIEFWTINDPVEAERLLALGADGIMTDDPAAIAPVFAARKVPLGVAARPS